MIAQFYILTTVQHYLTTPTLQELEIIMYQIINFLILRAFKVVYYYSTPGT